MWDALGCTWCCLEVPKQGSAGMLAPTPGGQWVSQDAGDASPGAFKDISHCAGH